MLARESNMLLAKPGMVLASYGQWPLEQQLPTASYNDLKKEKDKHRRNSPICAPLPASFSLWEDPIFTPRTGKIPSVATPQTRESASAGMHCTHPREVSDAQATPGAVLSNCKQLPAWVHRSCLFSSMGRTPCFDQIFLGQSFIYQPKTEPKQQSVASLQLLPRALLFHLCVWGY